MTAMPNFTTERLVIRPFSEADFNACLVLYEIDPADGPSVDSLRCQLLWASLNHAVLADLRQPPYGDRAVVDRASGAVVGAVGLVPSLGPFGQLPFFKALEGGRESHLFTAEVGLYWATTPAWRGQGIAMEAARALIAYAFEHLSLRRVVATTEHGNAASIAVMRRLGMTIERNPLPEPSWFQVVGVRVNERAG